MGGGMALICLAAFSLSSTVSNAANPSEIASVQKSNVTVKGTVVDSKGEPVVGASVVAGPTLGVVTDLDGKYSIDVPSNAVLTVSSVGYKTVIVEVNGKAVINVTLEEDVEFLDDVVVVGYGVQKKATLTGSISAVNGDELKKVSTTNLSNTLAGKTAGVIANTRSGEPGNDSASILIRGKGTLGDTSPLIVVDGIADRSFSRLNPEDIESISILKDASAAIYGARAANGVILVTTKRGKEGKVSLNYSGSYTMSQPTKVPKMLNVMDYMTYVNEYDAIVKHEQPGQTFPANVLEAYKTGSDPITYPSCNWWEATSKNWTSTTNHSVSLSGGSEKVRFYTSAQYMWQDAIYKKAAQDYSQAQFVSNIDAQVTNKIRFSLDILGRRSVKNGPAKSTGSLYDYFLRLFPNTTPYFPDGKPRVYPDGIDRNPALAVTNAAGYTKSVSNTLTIKPDLHIDLDAITKGLYVEGYAAIDMDFYNGKGLYRPFDIYSFDGEFNSDGTPIVYNEKDRTGVISVDNSTSNSTTVTINARLGYQRTFKDVHNVNAFVAYEQMKYNYHEFSAGRTNFISDAIPELFAGSENPDDLSNSGSSGKDARANFFGRINYGYKDKYLAEFTFRADGSSNFKKGNQWGVLPFRFSRLGNF